MPKIKITTTTYSCPHCHQTFKSDSDGWKQLLMLLFLPVIIFGLLWIIANSILLKLFEGYDSVKVGSSTKPCPHCYAPISTGKIEYHRLNDIYKKNYDFRWYYRFSVFLGGLLIFFLLTQFSRATKKTADIEIANILLIASFAILGIIFGIWVYWRSLNNQPGIRHKEYQSKKSIKPFETKKEKLEELKMLFDDELISEAEYTMAKKSILDE